MNLQMLLVVSTCLLGQRRQILLVSAADLALQEITKETAKLFMKEI